MSDSKDKESKQGTKESEQREADRKRTKEERQQAVEEAAKRGFGTVHTDKDKYPTDTIKEDTEDKDIKVSTQKVPKT